MSQKAAKAKNPKASKAAASNKDDADSSELHSKKLDTAEAAVLLHLEHYSQSVSFLFKTILSLNGAACIATLTLLGTTASIETGKIPQNLHLLMSRLEYSLSIFALGTAFVVFGLLARTRQLHYDSDRAMYIFREIRDKANFKDSIARCNRRARRARNIVRNSIVVSFGCFLGGLLFVTGAIRFLYNFLSPPLIQLWQQSLCCYFYSDQLGTMQKLLF